MGILSDRLGARLAEMRERHDREHAEMQRELSELRSDLAKQMRLTDELLTDLSD